MIWHLSEYIQTTFSKKEKERKKERKVSFNFLHLLRPTPVQTFFFFSRS